MCRVADGFQELSGQRKFDGASVDEGVWTGLLTCGGTGVSDVVKCPVNGGGRAGRREPERSGCWAPRRGARSRVPLRAMAVDDARCKRIDGERALVVLRVSLFRQVSRR